MELKELSKLYRESGIVGAGGAGFPTYAKLNNNVETVLLNCAVLSEFFNNGSEVFMLFHKFFELFLISYNTRVGKHFGNIFKSLLN